MIGTGQAILETLDVRPGPGPQRAGGADGAWARAEPTGGALALTLSITDPELRLALEEFDENERHDFAVKALKIGVLALSQARGRIDAERIREEGERLMSGLSSALDRHERGLTDQIRAQIARYFDPSDGSFHQRVEQLIRKDGDLERVLREKVGASDSELSRTLDKLIGDQSPLMRKLSPETADGLPAAIREAVAATLAEQRERILEQFSLDNRTGALARLVDEVVAKTDKASASLGDQVRIAVDELSLNREDSALSRLMGRVETAQKQISAQFSLDEQGSALARMRRELLAVIEAQRASHAQFQEQVLQKLTDAAARREEVARSARRGLVFEDALFEDLGRMCQAAGDVAIRTGAFPGLAGKSKKGDAVIELGCDHAAAGARIVIEAKEQAGFALKAALAELEEARKNRDAAVGLFVFSARAAPAGAAPLVRYGSDVIVVWDAEERASDVVLAAGLSVAKAIATRRAVRDEASAADFDGVERAIRTIEKRAEDLDQIATWATTVRNNGDNILKKAGALKDELRAQIEALDAKTRDLRNLLAAPE